MNFRIIPVIVTAAITSAATFFIANHFFQNTPYFTAAASHQQSGALLTGYDNNTRLSQPANFELAAASSVKAVVHIRSTINGRTATISSNDLFSRLFGPQQYFIPQQQESGSGVVISPDGYIVTNNHVIANADEVNVTFNDRFSTKASVIGADPSTDIAVLKIEGRKDLSYLEFGNSDDARLGQWVLAVGYPLSLDATVTAGIISAKGRSIGVNKAQSASAIESFIQTDAAVNPGNSGGALVNTEGQLIGINSAIASPTGSYAGYSYAIPSNIVRKAVNDLVKYGAVQRAYLGLQIIDGSTAKPEDVQRIGLDRNQGVYVQGVQPNSGAAKAGLRKGDYMTAINGQSVNTQSEVEGQVARFQPGDNISVAYTRDGRSYTTNVQLVKAENLTHMLGAHLRPLDNIEKHKYNIDMGLVVTDPGSGALGRQTQIEKGFVITSVNNVVVRSTSDFEQIVSANRVLQIVGFYPGHPGMYYYGVNAATDGYGEL